MMTFDEAEAIVKDNRKLIAPAGARMLWSVAVADRDRLKKSHADLLAACKDLMWLGRMPDETHNDQLERMAERFNCETGMLAPYKDQAAALCGTPTQDERRTAYDEWCAGFYAGVCAAIANGEKVQDDFR